MKFCSLYLILLPLVAAGSLVGIVTDNSGALTYPGANWKICDQVRLGGKCESHFISGGRPTRPREAALPRLAAPSSSPVQAPETLSLCVPIQKLVKGGKPMSLYISPKVTCLMFKEDYCSCTPEYCPKGYEQDGASHHGWQGEITVEDLTADH
jgi:hypothetical protein